MQMTTIAPPTETELNDFLGQAVTDFGAAATIAMVYVGDQLGLYAGLVEGGAQTPEELAARTRTHPRLVREWLHNQAAAGYVAVDGSRFALTPASAFALADPDSPVFLGGMAEVLKAVFLGIDQVAEGFRTGKGVGWAEHDTSLFRGTERFFRPGYAANLVPEWLPALEGVVAKLTAGARVADIGCGHGASTALMAEAFPASHFVGFDYHEASIEAARRATTAGNASFEVAAATETPGADYDLVATFDCLHDMGDPVAAARRIRQIISPDGTWLLVEPFAGEALQDNLNPVGRLFYGVSTAICTSHGVSQGDDECLGAQAGLGRLTKVAHDAGFTRVRLAAQTPFNLIIEVRP
jgi:SAM-dependent methyltransferase